MCNLGDPNTSLVTYDDSVIVRVTDRCKIILLVFSLGEVRCLLHTKTVSPGFLTGALGANVCPTWTWATANTQLGCKRKIDFLLVLFLLM